MIKIADRELPSHAVPDPRAVSYVSRQALALHDCQTGALVLQSVHAHCLGALILGLDVPDVVLGDFAGT